MKNSAVKLIRSAAAFLTAAIMICATLAGCVSNPDGPDPEPTEEPVVMRDISNDTKFAKTVVYANETANSIQARYTDGTRAGYEVFNDEFRDEPADANCQEDRGAGHAGLAEYQEQHAQHAEHDSHVAGGSQRIRDGCEIVGIAYSKLVVKAQEERVEQAEYVIQPSSVFR